MCHHSTLVTDSLAVRELKELTREYETINNMMTQFKNQLHAKKHSKFSFGSTKERLKQSIKMFSSQLKTIMSEIEKIIKKDPELYTKVDMIVNSLKGVGLITIAKIIAETSCFSLIKNKNQLSSYAGLDVIEDSSGNRIGKTKISSKGNSHLRHALFMPALSAIKYIHEMKNLYIRICEKHKAKKVGLTAVMRKLLILNYTLWKKNEPYNPAYNSN